MYNANICIIYSREMKALYKEKILKRAQDIKEELISIRRYLHMNPEPGLMEINTSHFVAQKLREIGLEVQTEVGITGVIGTLKGKYPGKTILLRADMDCLKIEEQNLFDFKSKNPGFMHACGHDAHMAWLLGAAMILSEFRNDLKGNVKFIFQPAEEMIGGAERMIKQGVLSNPKVDAAIGAHVWPSIESGKIGVKYGPMMAAPDVFKIKILGKGGHGAMPHNCVDPIAIACQVYLGLQTIVSRKVSPTDPLVITISTFNAGSAANIIPDEAELTGTTRTFDDDLRERLPLMMENVIKGITAAHGGSYEFEYNKCYPAVINDSSMAKLAESSVSELLGIDNVEILPDPEMIGEDFSFYQRAVPGVFLAIGTRNEDKGIDYPLHSANFNLDEDIIPRAAAVFAYCAIKYINQ
jgi:amidohydrolase